MALYVRQRKMIIIVIITMSVHPSPKMQNNIENKWEKYNLNGMEEFADKNGIIT